MEQLYSVGATVFVDDYLKAYIIDYNMINDIAHYIVKYIVGSYVEKNVVYDRIKACNIASESHNRSELARNCELDKAPAQPSSSSISTTSTTHHSCNTTRHTTTAAVANGTTSHSSNSSTCEPHSPLYTTLKDPIGLSFKLHTAAQAAKMSFAGSVTNQDHTSGLVSSLQSEIDCQPCPHPLMQFLIENNDKPKGWLRDCISNNTNNNKKNTILDHKSKSILLTTSSILSSLWSNNYSFSSKWPQILSHAFGVGKNRIASTQTEYISHNFDLKRKERSDKGSSIFNSPKKR